MNELATVSKSIGYFVQAVRNRFPGTSPEFFLVGSRARGTHQPDSDIDIAIVFADDGWSEIDRVGVLGELTFDTLVDDGVDIEGHPFTKGDWSGAASKPLAASMRRDAVRIA